MERRRQHVNSGDASRAEALGPRRERRNRATSRDDERDVERLAIRARRSRTRHARRHSHETGRVFRPTAPAIGYSRRRRPLLRTLICIVQHPRALRSPRLASPRRRHHTDRSLHPSSSRRRRLGERTISERSLAPKRAVALRPPHVRRARLAVAHRRSPPRAPPPAPPPRPRSPSLASPRASRRRATRARATRFRARPVGRGTRASRRRDDDRGTRDARGASDANFRVRERRERGKRGDREHGEGDLRRGGVRAAVGVRAGRDRARGDVHGGVAGVRARGAANAD
mmetsp:Transcript_6590/g.26487  ORF Transcript_6590/g.26487 Transcript_6590/m.26487 type:complete len:285 (-) Transcript_6590:2223-3077(-)